eukprot:scaffold474_cov365-Prasinococcus_capsulatus_cf.AAC.3
MSRARRSLPRRVRVSFLWAQALYAGSSGTPPCDARNDTGVARMSIASCSTSIGEWRAIE